MKRPFPVKGRFRLQAGATLGTVFTTLGIAIHDTMERKTDSGPQKLSFGVHRLSPGERLLFHTAPLVEGRRLWARPFDSTRLLRHACTSRAMPNEEWMDHLLERSLKAHKDSLPTGALLVSVVCEEVVGTT